MKKYNKYILSLMIVLVFSALSSCIDEDELTIPFNASPVLVMVSGNSFPAAGNVVVSARVYELDKTNILDHTLGIDSIAVANFQVNVLVNDVMSVASFTTDAAGQGMVISSWEDLGMIVPETGNSLVLEFSGIHNDLPFRKRHTISVE